MSTIHPRNLATLRRVFGLDGAALECRVALANAELDWLATFTDMRRSLA